MIGVLNEHAWVLQKRHEASTIFKPQKRKCLEEMLKEKNSQSKKFNNIREELEQEWIVPLWLKVILDEMGYKSLNMKE